MKRFRSYLSLFALAVLALSPRATNAQYIPASVGLANLGDLEDAMIEVCPLSELLLPSKEDAVKAVSNHAGPNFFSRNFSDAMEALDEYGSLGFNAGITGGLEAEARITGPVTVEIELPNYDTINLATYVRKSTNLDGPQAPGGTNTDPGVDIGDLDWSDFSPTLGASCTYGITGRIDFEVFIEKDTETGHTSTGARLNWRFL